MIVTPKPAATVILLDSQARIYLTKRPHTMKFMGGYYVFPGGAVEKSDYELSQHERHRPPDPRDNFDPVFYVAAIRELFEETRILMTKDEFTMDRDKQQQYRQSLIEGEISLGDMLERENIVLNPKALTHIAHFTTPTFFPIRYDTRFFLTQLPANQSPDPDKREIADSLWLTPEEALEASKKGELLLALPTKRALKTVIEMIKK